jgi:5-dehydro-4-deoxyglucarate dehydratase
MTIQRGIIGFPVAHFNPDFSLNLPALESAVDALVQHPFCAINAPAGISEAFSLSTDEAVDIARATVRTVAGRMPVIGCVTGGYAIASDCARRMEEAGADALLVLPPTYPNAPFDGLLAYYRAIGKSTGLPLALYSRGWASFTPDEVARLAEAVPTLTYWKDGQGDTQNYQDIMSLVGGRLIWIGGAGDSRAADYAAIGLEIFTSSISAVSPRLALAWGDAALAGDTASLDELLERYVHPLFTIRARRRGYEVAAMKKLADWAGLAAGPCRPPLPALAPTDETDLREVFLSWKTFLD